MRGWKNVFNANGNQKKTQVAILIWDKIHFKTSCKKEYYIMIKGWILEEDITIVNIYTSNIEAPKYIKQILTHIKGEIDNNTIIVGNFNTSLTSMDKSSKQKMNKEMP